MARGRALIVVFWATVCAVSVAQARSVAPRAVTLHLPAVPSAASSQRDVRVEIFDLGPARDAELRFAGQLGNGKGPGEVVSLVQAAKSLPNSLIVAAGYSGKSASTPSGLLFVNGVTINPLVPAWQSVGGIHFDTIVCFEKQNNQVSMVGPEDIASMPDVRQQCRSAFQAYPRILKNGSPTQKGKSEPTTPPARRVVYGGDSNGSDRVVIFMDPISLPAATAFLREHDDGKASVTASITGDRYRFSGGAGLIDAVSLGEDGEPAVVFMGKPVVGDPYRPSPSLMVFRY